MSKLDREIPRWLLRVPIAHRGLHDGNNEIPENSLAAFEKAKKAGIAVECDIHLLEDGSVAVFHDADLDRLTDRNGPVSSLTAKECRNTFLSGTREHIPLLEELLQLIGGDIPILIELKTEKNAGPLEEAAWKILSGYKGDIAVQSFNPFSLEWYALNAPEILRGQLSCNFRGEKLDPFRKFVLRNMLLNRKSKPHFISYGIDSLPNRKVKRFRSRGIPVLGWTARTEEQKEKAQRFCDNIIFELIEP